MLIPSRGGQADVFGQREEEEVVQVREGDPVGVHHDDALEVVVEEEGEELVEAAAVVQALRVAPQVPLHRPEHAAVLDPLRQYPLAVRRGQLCILCFSQFLHFELNFWRFHFQRVLQGDKSGRRKPPVDLDLGCSTIMPGQ